MIKKSSLKVFSVISSLSFLSSILGYLRDAMLVRNYGVSLATDAFFSALLLPNILFPLLISGSIAQVALPIFLEHYQKNKEDAWVLVNSLLNLTFLSLSLLSLAGIFFGKGWLPVLMPGFSQEGLDLTYRLNFFLFPTIVFFSLSSLVSVFLQAHQKFTVPALAPIVSNLTVVTSIIVSKNLTNGIFFVAIGMLISSMLQLVFQLPQLIQSGARWAPYIAFRHSGLKKIYTLALPLMIYLSISYASKVFERQIASTLGEGAITILSIALRVFLQIPSIFSFSFAAIIFPELSNLIVQNNLSAFRRVMINSINTMVFLLLPSSFWLIIFGKDVISLLFEYGGYSSQDVIATSQSLSCYLVGLLPIGLTMIIQRGIFAMKDTKSPVIIGAISLAIYLLTAKNMAFLFGVPGLSISSSISYIVVMLLSLLRLAKITNFNLSEFKVMLKNFYLIMLASLFMALVVLAGGMFLLESVAFGAKVLRLTLGAIAGVVAYFVAGSFLRIETVQQIKNWAFP